MLTVEDERKIEAAFRTRQDVKPYLKADILNEIECFVGQPMTEASQRGIRERVQARLDYWNSRWGYSFGVEVTLE